MRDSSDKIKWNMGKLNYQRNVELGILTALVCIILFFFVYQKVDRIHSTNLELYPALSIKMIEMPRTVQEKNIRKMKPQLPFLPVPAEETEILKDVVLLHEQIIWTDSLNLQGATSSPLMARQVFEVLPQKPDLPIHGAITLSIKIGIQGKVVEHIIVNNSTGSELYLKRVLEAVKKSRWQPARINGKFVESWVQKTYHIDNRFSD